MAEIFLTYPKLAILRFFSLPNRKSNRHAYLCGFGQSSGKIFMKIRWIAIHLSVTIEGRIQLKKAAIILATMESKGANSRWHLPGIYVYYNNFQVAGENKERCLQRLYHSDLKAYDWKKKWFSVHENTIVSAVEWSNDLLKNLKIQGQSKPWA